MAPRNIESAHEGGCLKIERARYAIVIEPLSEEDGGGFVVTVPDLPGCMSDGETREEAARNIGDAIHCWLEEARELGRAVPPARPALRIA